MPNIGLEILAGDKVSEQTGQVGSAPTDITVGVPVGPPSTVPGPEGPEGPPGAPGMSTGGGEVAYSENASSASLYLTETPAANDNNVILVDGDGQAYWLEWGINLRVVVGGQGSIMASVYEIIDGVANFVGIIAARQYPSSQAVTQNGGHFSSKLRVDGSTEDRLFALFGEHEQEGSSFAGAFHNLELSPTWFRAVKAV